MLRKLYGRGIRPFAALLPASGREGGGGGAMGLQVWYGLHLHEMQCLFSSINESWICLLYQICLIFLDRWMWA